MWTTHKKYNLTFFHYQYGSVVVKHRKHSINGGNGQEIIRKNSLIFNFTIIRSEYGEMCKRKYLQNVTIRGWKTVFLMSFVS